MGEAAEADKGELGTGKDTAPMAKKAVCRQTPEVGAVCVNAHVRICAGVQGNPHSYRNMGECIPTNAEKLSHHFNPPSSG